MTTVRQPTNPTPVIIRSWRSELPLWLLLAANAALALYGQLNAPDIVPLHWNMDGRPDGQGDRLELLLMPLVSLVTYAAMILLPRFDPGRANYAQFSGAYYAMRLSTIAGMTALHTLFLAGALGAVQDVSSGTSVITGALIVVLGNLVGKVRPNFFVGIRTPWTLTSKRAWVKTHRVGGWVLIAIGLLLCAAGLSGRTNLSPLMGATGALSVAGLALYSYLIWRTDPDRISPAGTQPA